MNAAVIGAGLGGLAAAIALRQEGLDVTVFEAASATRLEGESISVWSNGTAALAALGVADLPGQPIGRMRVQDLQGRVLLEIDGDHLTRRWGDPNLTLPRQDLLDLLASRVDRPVVYGRRCVTASTLGDRARVVFADGTSEEADLVIGADGVHSTVRQALWPGDSEQFVGAGTWQGTTALPADYPSRSLVLATVGHGTLACVFPTTHDKVLWFIDEHCANPDVPPASGHALGERFGSWPEPLPTLIGSTPADDVRFYPIYVRRPRRSWAQGRVILIGDAAHAMAPALGQGASQAFTDAVVLARCIRRHPSIESAFGAYQRHRVPATFLNWQLSRLSLAHRGSRLFEYGYRLAPERLATTVFGRLLRPARAVRRATRTQRR